MVHDDFNSILDQKDKIGYRSVSSSSIDGLKGVVHTNGLIDLGFCVHAFT